MPDLSITTTSVLKGTGATTEKGTAGAAITAGQPVYKDATDSNKFKLCDADGAAALRVVYGIALHGAASGQPLTVQKSGPITIGATVDVGEIYVLSPNAGKICPMKDLHIGDYLYVIGVGTSATQITLALGAGGGSAVATALSGYLTGNVVFDRVKTAQSVGTGDVDSDIVDMGSGPDYTGILFVIVMGAITDGTPDCFVESGADSGLSDAAVLSGTQVSFADDDDNQIMLLDCTNVVERYVRCTVSRGGSTGSVVDAIIALKYRPTAANNPTSQTADVSATQQVDAPAEV